VPTTAVVAIPVDGGSAQRVCPAECMARWSPDGARFYVEPILQGLQNGMTVAVPVPKGRSLPALPAAGIRTAQDSHELPGSTVINLATFDPGDEGQNIAPGQGIDTFAYAKKIVHRNLFQIPLP
jgi:hypothetical protein